MERRLSVAIVPIASIHIRVGPVPAEIGLRRVGNDANPVRGQNRSEDHPADEFAIIRPAVPVPHVGVIVPIFCSIVILFTPTLAPMLVVVFAPILVVIPILVPVIVPLIPVLAALAILLGDDDHPVRSCVGWYSRRAI